MTLLEVVVTIVILATIAGIVGLSAEASSAIGGEAKRATDAARKLALIRDAAVRWNQGGRNDSSFTFVISGSTGGVNPGRLSELYDSITTSDRNSCGAVYTVTFTGRWKHAFTPIALPKTTPRSTYLIATGYAADDSLIRFDSSGTSTTATSITAGSAGYNGTLAIVLKNVSLSDAKRLEGLMEGEHDHTLTTASGVVRFAETDPTTVFYHMGIHGC